MMSYDLPLQHSIQSPSSDNSRGEPLLILLHGFMEHEESMQRVASRLHHGFRVVSVRAPIQIGEHSYGWARARFTPRGPEEDEEEFESSRRMVLDFLEEMQSAYGPGDEPAYMMGFSQGASLCLSVAVTEGERLAGAVAVGGKLLEKYSGVPGSRATGEVPAVFVAHGTDDRVVPIERAREDARRLSELQPGLTYREYGMGHEIGDAALRDVAAWLYAGRVSEPDLSKRSRRRRR